MALVEKPARRIPELAKMQYIPCIIVVITQYIHYYLYAKKELRSCK